MDSETRIDNVSAIGRQLENFFTTAYRYCERRGIEKEIDLRRFQVVNNHSWWKDVKMLDFLGNYGRHIRIQNMLARDSISARIGTSDGLGFNEFTYQVLQAYDFYHLYKNEGVSIQVGGGDQWGNITAGIDFISRVEPNSKKSPPYAITSSLLTTANGDKFGKSAGNAIFINRDINSPYDIFQYFLNVEDADIEKFLKIFTLLSLEDINSIMKMHNKDPKLREGQKTLAREVTELIHGYENCRFAEILSDMLFNDKLKDSSVSVDSLLDAAYVAGNYETVPTRSSLVEIISKVTNCSNSEAKRRISQGGVYLGLDRIQVTDPSVSINDYILQNEVLILRTGKRKCYVVNMSS
ncbi:hypothetical protein Kpol_1074p1 [Vanderwaltozyma polyspora DSM 70294]|uniref:Tyrosine--tRNA ligase n=1 Tax=Vanderwaltozyma polyspora (strain ATCC 22028 / DSM 70294 / BCRC 21397 / CBS 2163 / NBRC 10782 / NRRL Y-8283 / UCD 57-17) TaxID=436907 RepID=A7TTQ5_VANPO|nr:uncharacterized protein Kpol_1074p1 [Vanderwaltozyma polyspora DSM 70294]EDO14348.1 hypothetical protein Kpol_1074p1 [Vanderwaltozyma polyspora DSM 70294]